jgi:hypothetical protein
VSVPAPESLYDLLPAIYRLRDAAAGEPLRALLGLIQTEFDALQADIGGLYENWFIETCDEWVVPYIGDLLRVRGLHPVSPGTFSQRAFVAHTLAYRRRKGTAAMLAQLARDVTGWPARVVEFFDLLAMTQYLNHLRLSKSRTADLRDTNQLELLSVPFEAIAHTVDVRHIASSRGKYNIPNLGIFLWRMQSYEITRSVARAATDVSDGRYRFNPLGLDIPLFNSPRTKIDPGTQDSEFEVPAMLRRRPLYDELEALRHAKPNGPSLVRNYFGEPPVFQIFKSGQDGPVRPEQILICDLDDWRRPVKGSVAVDPVLGRLVFPIDENPAQVLLTHSYGAVGDVGGGPYNRQESVSAWLEPQDAVTWQVGVTHDPKMLADDQASGVKQLFGSMSDAVAAWNNTGSKQSGAFGVIAVLDNSMYHEDLVGQSAIRVPAGCKLAVVAANWPAEHRIPGRVIPEGLRPHLRGRVEVSGSDIVGNFGPGEFVVDGLLIEGTLTVLPGSLGSLLISHCTIVPSKGGLTIHQAERLTVSLKRSICGRIAAPDTLVGCTLIDCIIDSTDETSVAYAAPNGVSAGPTLDIQNSTVVGKVHTVLLRMASNTLLMARLAQKDPWSAPVIADRRQEGCVRFSFVPSGARTPRRFRCQPDLAVNETNDPVLSGAIRARLTPLFTSLVYGQPGYGQLSLTCADEIRMGAEDGSEMGVLSFLKHPQREANLHASLEEYLRFGLEAGLFFVN